MNFQINPVDVLFGRTKQALNHPGTIAFRALVEECLPRYHKNVSRTFKTTIAAEIMLKVKSKGGRFMRFYAAENRWKVISDNSTKDTVTQSLRDLRRAMEDDQRSICPVRFSHFYKRLSKKRRIPRVRQGQGIQESKREATSSCYRATPQMPCASVHEGLKSMTVSTAISYPCNTDRAVRSCAQENAVSTSKETLYGGFDSIGFVDLPQYRRCSLQLYERDDQKAQGSCNQYTHFDGRGVNACSVLPATLNDRSTLFEESWSNGHSTHEQRWRFLYGETNTPTRSVVQNRIAVSYNSMSIQRCEGDGKEHIGNTDAYGNILDTLDHVIGVSQSFDDDASVFDGVANQYHCLEPLKFSY